MRARAQLANFSATPAPRTRQSNHHAIKISCQILSQKATFKILILLKLPQINTKILTHAKFLATIQKKKKQILKF